jgi:hypothetical protein
MADDVFGRPKLELGADRKKLQADLAAAAQDAKKAGKEAAEAFGKGARDSKASERSFESLQRRIKSITQDLSGNKATGRLQELALAVQKMGGASKLTEVNLERLRNQIKGLQAQGGKAPKALQALIPAPGKVAPTTQAIDNLKLSLSSSAQSLGPFGAGLSALGPAGLAAAAGVAVLTAGVGKLIGTLVAWSRESVELSTSISEMSLETGMGTDAVQEWVYAGSKVGMQGPQVSKAIGDMTRKIAEGSTLTRKAVADLGLSFDDVRKMRPEQQFETVLRAIRAVGDEGKQSAIKTALMSEELSVLKLIRSDFDGLRKEAHEYGAVINGEVLAANDELGRQMHALDQSWQTFKATLVAGITTSPEAAEAIDDIAQALGRLTAQLLGALPEIRSAVNILTSLGRVAVAGAATGGFGAGTEYARQFKGKSPRTGIYDASGRRLTGGGKQLPDGSFAAPLTWEAPETPPPGASGSGGTGGGSKPDDAAIQRAAAAAAKLRDINKRIHEERLRMLPTLDQQIAKIDLATAAAVAQADAELKAGRITKAEYSARVAALETLAQEQKVSAQATAEAAVAAEDKRKADQAAAKATQAKAKADAEAHRIQELLGTSQQQAVQNYADLNAALEANGGLTNLSREQLENYLGRLNALRGQDIPGLYQAIGQAQAEAAARGMDLDDSAKKQTVTFENLSRAVHEVTSALDQMGIAGDSALGSVARAADGVMSSIGQMSSGNWVGGVAGAFTVGWDLAESLWGPDPEQMVRDHAASMGLVASDEFWSQFQPGDNLWDAYYLGLADVAKDQGKTLAEMSGDIGLFFQTADRYGEEGRRKIAELFDGLLDEVSREVPGALEALGQATDLVFQQMRTGQMSAATGTELLGGTISSLGDAAEAGVAGARDELRALIREAKAAGLEIPEITALIRDGLSEATAGLGKLPPILTQRDAADQAQLFATTWNATVEEMGVGAAVAQMGDAWARLQEQAQAGGFDISGILGPKIAEIMAAARPDAAIAALDEALKRGDITQEERDTQVAALQERADQVGGIDALQSIARGLDKADVLDPKAFEALQRQAATQYERLVEGGMSAGAAQELIGPLLAQLQGQAADFGLELAPELQDILGDSGLALRADKTAEMADSIKSDVAPALWQLVELQGGVAPALEDMGKAIGAIGAGGGRPEIQIPDMPRLGDGGIVSSRLAAIVGESGPEVVAPLDRLPDLIRGAIGGAAPGTPIEITVVSQLDGQEVARNTVRRVVGGGPESRALADWIATGER